MVLVGREHLPTPFLLVVVTPDPVATTKLRGEEARLLVKVDHLLTLSGWIAHQMPDRLRRLIAGRLIDEIVVVIVDRLAAIHPAVAVGFRLARALTAAGDGGHAEGPLTGQLKHGHARAIPEPHIGPFPSAARLFPQDAS
jgi:hypothetical protein